MNTNATLSERMLDLQSEFGDLIRVGQPAAARIGGLARADKPVRAPRPAAALPDDFADTMIGDPAMTTGIAAVDAELRARGNPTALREIIKAAYVAGMRQQLHNRPSDLQIDALFRNFAEGANADGYAVTKRGAIEIVEVLTKRES